MALTKVSGDILKQPLNVGIITATSINVSGISTLGITSATSLVVSGISTLGITSTTNLTSQSLVVSGISTLGITTATNLTSQSLVVSGISTFTNGPILVGTATSTGTASQRLQVTGGAYVSGNLGVGTTNPTAKLQVVGDTRVSGVVTAFDFYNDAEYPSVRPTLDLAFAQTKILDSRITFTRASTATYVNASGLIASAAVNEARFDHDPYTGESLGLLVEEVRTNLSISSEDFSNASYWASTSQTVVPNAAISPNGTVTADNIIPAAGTNAVRYLYYNVNAYSMSVSTTYTSSVFVKKNGLRYFALQVHDDSNSNGHRAGFDLDNGIVVASTVNNMASATGATASIVPYPNGWYRCIITGTTAGTGTTGRTAFSFTSSLDANASVSSISADGTSGGFIWGMQVEAGAFPTSYIPTSGSTVTRSADVASMTGTNFSSWYNQSSGTVVANVLASQGTRPPVASASVLGIIPSEVVPGNLIYQNADNNGTWYTYDSGILELVQTINLNPNGNKFAWGLTAGASSVAVKDGATRGSYSWSSIARTGFLIGTENIGSIRWKRITYYPVRLPDAQLQTITL